MSKSTTANFVNIFMLALLPVSILVHAFWLPLSVSGLAISDAGYVSIITLTFVACSFIAILTIVFNTNLLSSKLTSAAAAYILAIYFLREADIHRLITVEHVTRGKFYTMPDVPLWQKLFAATVFLILAVCILYILINYARKLWTNLRAFEPWSIALFLWFVVLCISQLCDRSDLNHTHVGRVIEENSECWAAIFLFLTVVQLIPTLQSQK